MAHQQGNKLELDRCPHCNVAKPHLNARSSWETTSSGSSLTRFWIAYACESCGGSVLTSAPTKGAGVLEMYPSSKELDEAIPDPAKEYLRQAISSLHAPAGAIMLAASSIDAMLKVKSYKDGSLYDRIKQAAKDHLITDEMATWAHDVRLDANDQRHADDKASLPDEEDASKCIEFAQALAEFLFVLPQRVERGRGKTE